MCVCVCVCVYVCVFMCVRVIKFVLMFFRVLLASLYYSSPTGVDNIYIGAEM